MSRKGFFKGQGDFLMADIGDLVLVHLEQDPVFFARVEDIVADSKPAWYQVRLMVLAVPSFEITWILREAYINGEPFTMEGKAMRIEKLPPPDALLEMKQEKKQKTKASGKVVELAGRR